MGFNLSGLLGPLLTVGTQAAGTYEQGNANAANQQTQNLLMIQQLKQAQAEQALKNWLMVQQGNEADALARYHQVQAGTPGSPGIPGVNPSFAAGIQGLGPISSQSPTSDVTAGIGGPAPAMGATPGVPPLAVQQETMRERLAQEQRANTWTPENAMYNGRPMVVQHNAYGQYRGPGGAPIDPTKLQPYAPPVQPQLISGVDPTTGQPYVYRVPKEGGAATPVPGITPKPSAGGLGGNAANDAKKQQFGLALKSFGMALPESTDPGLAGGMISAEAQRPSAFGQAANWLTQKNANTSQYQTYANALAGAIMAAAHAVGGARINEQQVAMFQQQMMIRAGDSANPITVAQKIQSAIDFLNTARATMAPGFAQTIESTMDPNALRWLRQHGYGGAPTPQGINAVQSVLPQDMNVVQMIDQAQNAGTGSGTFDPIAWAKANARPGEKWSDFQARLAAAQAAAGGGNQ